MNGDDALSGSTAGVSPAKRSASGPLFAHASEAELARILDFYEVRWEYEPHTFPILWNLDGDVVESFSPDFYLADFDAYVELTTLRQPLVRKKNRKLRRLRELYPDIRIKLLYARDFRALMLKYGKFALLDALSGTPGQVVPIRSTPEDALASSERPETAAMDEPRREDATDSRGAAPISLRRARRRRRRPSEVAIHLEGQA